MFEVNNLAKMIDIGSSMAVLRVKAAIQQNREIDARAASAKSCVSRALARALPPHHRHSPAVNEVFRGIENGYTARVSSAT